jgi:hypothetical protein
VVGNNGSGHDVLLGTLAAERLVGQQLLAEGAMLAALAAVRN